MRYLAESKPSVLLDGIKPLLIDEWQEIPSIWNAVRFSIDSERKRGLYVLTGSAIPTSTNQDLSKLHIGTGRISRLLMRPMSLYESGDSNGIISLKDLFEGKDDFIADSDFDFQRIALLVCRGGWPSALDLNPSDSFLVSREYVKAIVNSDISRADGIRHNPYTAEVIMRSLARNICTLADISVIKQDINGRVERKTISQYIDTLRNIYVVEDTPAWSPALLSKARLRASPKRNFVDPSLAAASLAIGPEQLMRNLPVLGSMFESLCIRDLRIYS